MKKQIKVVVLNPERLSKNLANVIADIYEKRIADGDNTHSDDINPHSKSPQALSKLLKINVNML